MLRWIRIVCVCLILVTYSHADDVDNGADDDVKDASGDVETQVVTIDLPRVSGRYTDFREDVIEEFREKIEDRRFRSSDVIDVDEDAPRSSQGQERALGGFVLNLGQFSGKGSFVPENVFGEKYTSSLISEPCKPAGFPFICEVRRLIDNKFICPVDVPYCQRIPCGSHPDLELNMDRCLKQPGCCFDQVLFNYRKYYGQTVLPRVPVCHQAVRNSYFHTVARKFADRFRGWNPLLTECLIKVHSRKIEKNVMECSSLEIFEHFGYLPKNAGWTDIVPRECGLIGGCWLHGKGCFYPPKMTQLQLRSSYETPINRPYSPFDLYGQPLCQPLNPYAKSEDFLHSYHQCLASGCDLDPAVTADVLLAHLYNLTDKVPASLMSSFKYEILLGRIRPDNWESGLEHFLKFGSKYSKNPFHQYGPHGQPNLPPEIMALLTKFPGPGQPGMHHPQPPMPGPGYGMHPPAFAPPPPPLSPYAPPPLSPYAPPPSYYAPPQSPPRNPFQVLTTITSTGMPPYPNPAPVYLNPNAFNAPQYPRYSPGTQGPGHYGGRTHDKTRINLYPMPCPYKLVRIPNFPPLDGKMDGCCDRNLCYMSRESVRQQFSGAAAYWGPWGFWSRCSVACGNAVQKRYRQCVGPSPNACAGPAEDKRSCNNLPTCRERLSKWAAWSTCEKPCGGFRVRTRRCLTYSCQGLLRERRPCPTDCKQRNLEKGKGKQ